MMTSIDMDLDEWLGGVCSITNSVKFQQCLIEKNDEVKCTWWTKNKVNLLLKKQLLMYTGSRCNWAFVFNKRILAQCIILHKHWISSYACFTPTLLKSLGRNYIGREIVSATSESPFAKNTPNREYRVYFSSCNSGNHEFKEAVCPWHFSKYYQVQFLSSLLVPDLILPYKCITC